MIGLSNRGRSMAFTNNVSFLLIFHDFVSYCVSVALCLHTGILLGLYCT